MTPPRSPYVTTFLAWVPTEFLQDVVDLITRDYRSAFDVCEQNLQEPEAHDARPHLRRGLIEQDLRAAAHRRGFTAEAVANSTKTHFHTEVTIGNVMITQNSVASPSEMVRHADFRDGLILEYQPSLFDDENEVPDPANTLYAIVLSGQHPMNPAAPCFIYIAFPVHGSKHYVARLDLIKYLEEIGATTAVGAAAVPAPTVTTRERTGPSVTKGTS